jgi:hypothetical protein
MRTIRTIKLAGVAAAAVCAVAGTSVATAQAAWTAPQVLPSPANGLSDKPTVAVAASGAAIVGIGAAAMEKPSQVAFRPAGATAFQRPISLHAAPLGVVWGDDSVPGVALLPDGSAIAVFDESTTDRGWGLYATTIRPDGTPGTPVRIADDDQVMWGIKLAVDGAGRVTATWEWSDPSTSQTVVRYALRGTDGTWTAPVSLGSRVNGWLLAEAQSGEAYIAIDGGTPSSQLLRRAGATGAFTHLTDPSAHGGDSSVSALSIDPAGGLAVTWGESWDDNQQRGMFYAVRTPGGTLGAAAALPSGAHEAVRAPGTTLLLGYRSVFPDDAIDPTLQTARVTEAAQPDGTTSPGAPHDVTPDGYNTPDDWAVAPDGTLVVPYVAEDPLTAQPIAMAATRAPDGTWSTPAAVGDQADQLTTSYSQPRSSIAAANGHAVMAWPVADATTTSIHVSAWSPGADAPQTEPTAPAATPATAPNSQTWQGGPEHTGAVTGTGLTGALSKAWTTDLGYQQVYAVQADGRVFAVSKVDGAQAVTALDVADGHVLWTAKLGQNAMRLAVGGGTLIAATDDGIYALDPATGTTRWHAADGGQWEPLPPIIAGSRVYVTAQGRGSTTFAYNLADGRQLWRQPGPTTQSITLAGNRVVAAPVCAGDGEYRAGFETGDGTRDWATVGLCGEGNYNTIATYDGRWVWLSSMSDVSENGRVLDPETGRILRTFEGGPPAFGPDGIGYRTDRGALVAFDPRTLAVRWRYAPSAPITVMPLVTDGLVSVQDQAGGVHVLNRWTGAVRYSTTGDAPGFDYDLPSALSAGDGHLIATTGSKLVAYNAAPAPPETPGPGEGDGGGTTPPATTTTDTGATTGTGASTGGDSSRGGGSLATTGTAPSTGADSTATATTPPLAPPTAVSPLFTATSKAAALPSWRLASTTATVDRAGRLVVNVRCDGPSASRCSGRLTIALARHTTLRSAALHVAAGHTATVHITLPRAGRAHPPASLTVRLGGMTGRLRVHRG